MRIGIVGNLDRWHEADLRRAAACHEAEGRPCALRRLSVENLIAAVGGETCDIANAINGEPLDSFDALLVRAIPPATLQQIVFRMDVLGEFARRRGVVVNSPRTIETAIDKFLTTARLQAAGLPVPRTLCCETVAAARDAFERLGGDVVCKPIFGGEGRGMLRIDHPALAERVFGALTRLGEVIYLQEFIAAVFDVRLLVVGERVYAIRRYNDNDWRKNLTRGGRATPFQPPADVINLGVRSAAAVGAVLCGVDLLPRPGGGWYVLEVNASPGWKGLSQTLQIDVAAAVLDLVEESVSRVLRVS